jgi:hypothetical protein
MSKFLYLVIRASERLTALRRFPVGWMSDFLREYAMLFGLPSRLDRIAMMHSEQPEIIGRGRTVTQGSQQ